jgi:hypothetical protein
MRPVVLQQFAISLDGYTCEEDTEFYRLRQGVPDDDELHDYVLTELRRARDALRLVTSTAFPSGVVKLV